MPTGRRREPGVRSTVGAATSRALRERWLAWRIACAQGAASGSATRGRMRRFCVIVAWLVALTSATAGGLEATAAGTEPAIVQTTYPFGDVDHFDPGRDYTPGERWSRLVEPEEAGWSRNRLADAVSFARDIGTDALLVVHAGLVVSAFGEVDAEFDLYSVRKSLMSVAFGVFVDRGVIDLEASLGDLGINDLAGLTPREKTATVDDLLTSRSGVYHPAAYETRRMREKRPARGSYYPGEFWFYNNWDFNVLSTIFMKETGYDFFEAFAREVATPLNFEHFGLEDTRYYVDEDASRHPAYLFEMSALDLARIGLLMLNNGEFNGHRILSRAWVEQSTSAIHVWDTDEPGAGYGYMWKVTPAGFYAAGAGAQRVFVVPQDRIVIVHLANRREEEKVRNDDVRALYDLILQAYGG